MKYVNFEHVIAGWVKVSNNLKSLGNIMSIHTSLIYDSSECDVLYSNILRILKIILDVPYNLVGRVLKVTSFLIVLIILKVSITNIRRILHLRGWCHLLVHRHYY